MSQSNENDAPCREVCGQVCAELGCAAAQPIPPTNRCGWDLCGEPNHRAFPPGGESDG